MRLFLSSLRALRIVVSIAIFCLIGAQFFDIYHSLPKAYYMYNPTGTQFVPSLLEALSGVGIVAAAAFISFTACALIFGRVYCSGFCPFGILMDILRRIFLTISKLPFLKKTHLGEKLRSSQKMKFARAHNIIRGFFLLLAALFIAFGFTSFLGFIEPYSLYGKIMGDVFRPLVVDSVDGLSNVLSHSDIYWVSPIDGNPHVGLAAFSIGLIILFGISIASALRARLYCNTVCPVGAWLGLFAKFSIFKIKLDKSACIKCGMCERNCKAQCINSKNAELDFSRCVLCFNCAKNCKKSAIVFEANDTIKSLFKKPQANAEKCEKCNRIEKDILNHKVSKNNSSMPRRKFASALGTIIGTLCLAAKGDGKGLGRGNQNCKNFPVDADASPFGVAAARADKRLSVPAGAGSLENFFEHCTGCQICVSACKANILKPALGEWGLAGLMQPYMDFSDGFCLYPCHACTKACPTGAIKFLTGKQKGTVKTGTAKFKKSLCVVKTDGTDCAACAEHCPVQAIEMLPFGDKKKALYIPFVHEEVCIGCGACEYICPVRPHRAIVIQGLSKHRKAKAWNESMRIHPLQKQAPSKSTKPDDGANPFPF